MSVSIIIPTYNRAAFLKNALNSVYRQTYQDFEVIVIDDGSTDNTEEVAKSFKGIIYIKQENSGLNASRNRAIKLAKGEFIALLDDDDWWMDFKLKLQVNILKKIPNTSFVYSDFIINKPSGTNINSGLSTWYEEENWKDIFDQNIELSSSDISITPGKKVRNIYIGDLYHPSLFDPYVLPATALIRRSSIPPGLTFTENDSTCGDWEYFARLSHHMPAAYIDMETAYNRSHESPTRLTRINKSVQLTRRINMIERVWES
ncbi:MAG: glycosyltransferase family 2 protein, partial [Gammaproteobacteria bacterium]|nr:glycosyltransferase family 2 protein [Gammaproteobacteria bacterium]